MLDIRAVSTASDLAAVLTTQGIQVSPKGGLPLNKLNQTLMGAGFGNLTGLTTDEESKKEFDPSWTAMMISNSKTTMPDGTPSEYQDYMEHMAEELATSVAGTISFSRNVVNPIIKDVCEKIAEALDNAGRGGSIAQTSGGQRFVMSNSSLVVNIIEEGPEPLYLDAVTDGEASARMRIPYQNLTSPAIFPEITSAQLFELMEQTANTDFQRDVLDVIKGLENGYEMLLDTYNNVYRQAYGGMVGCDIRSLTNDMSLRPLIILAIGNALGDELPDGTVGNATNVTDTVLNWTTQVKNIIEINVESYKASLKEKRIVLNSFTENYEVNIHVNKENYNSYLEDGGATEALLGSSFTDKDYDYDNLISRQQEYEQAYEGRVAEAAAFNEANCLTIFKNSLREQIYDHIFNCDEDAIRPVIPAEAREALDCLMKTIYADALDEPHKTVRRVVCNTLFLGTDAEEILVNIDNMCEKNDNLSVRDAGALVTLDYLTKYLVKQMNVCRTL